MYKSVNLCINMQHNSCHCLQNYNKIMFDIQKILLSLHKLCVGAAEMQD